MSRSASPVVAPRAFGGQSTPTGVLLSQLVRLVVPLLAEQTLHMAVGLTDVYVAGHLPQQSAAAQAAVGSIAYVLWLFGMVAAALGTGATALIARAVGARHRSLANGVCGQTVSAALLVGALLGIGCAAAAEPFARLTGLSGQAREFAFEYLRIIAISLPFSTLMLAGGACLRGAGDTLTPALSMILVDSLNVLATTGLTRGLYGLPAIGFPGIAIGTTLAYVAGGIVLFSVLIRGSGALRLHLHRMRLHVLTLRRILRVGVPAAFENLLNWAAQFTVLKVINSLDHSNVMGSAHICTIRIESLSYLFGFAVATAAATMVGQSLGAGDERRATRSAYLAFAVGGGLMGVWGLMFVAFPRFFAQWLSSDPDVAALTARCLHITGFIQVGFAASMIFSGALRGAGDTLMVMVFNLASVLGLRLLGVLVVALLFKQGLPAIWVVLSGELLARGLLVYGRFVHGGWRNARV